MRREGAPFALDPVKPMGVREFVSIVALVNAPLLDFGLDQPPQRVGEDVDAFV